MTQTGFIFTEENYTIHIMSWFVQAFKQKFMEAVAYQINKDFKNYLDLIIYIEDLRKMGRI